MNEERYQKKIILEVPDCMQKPYISSDMMKKYIYLKLAGENTAIQSSLDGVGELKSTVTQTVVSP